MALKGKTNEEKIWNYLIGKGLTACGAAALMGNLYAESGLQPQNLQNTYERKLGLTDAEYTAAVDSGSYTNFVRDAAGYGLAQWTYWSRKLLLLDHARACGASIGDLEIQLSFLYEELFTRYRTVWEALRTADNIKAASDIVLTKYERPKDQSEKAKIKRANYGHKYFTKYGKKTAPAGNTSTAAKVNVVKVDPARSRDKSLAGTYKATVNLNMRAGAGTGKRILLTVPLGGKVKCYGYYTMHEGTKWLYVVYEGMTGFCSSEYLKR